jgi:hypothetical protein
MRESLDMPGSNLFAVFGLPMSDVSGRGMLDPLNLHCQLTRCTREFLIELTMSEK